MHIYDRDSDQFTSDGCTMRDYANSLVHQRSHRTQRRIEREEECRREEESKLQKVERREEKRSPTDFGRLRQRKNKRHFFHERACIDFSSTFEVLEASVYSAWLCHFSSGTGVELNGPFGVFQEFL